MKSFIRKIKLKIDERGMIGLLVLANINYQNTTREINKNMIDNSVTEEKSVTDKEKLDKVYNDKDSYPEELLEMLSRNNDMLDYVYKYKENKGKVFSIEEIYINVWNGECYAAENVIAVHIRHIREKIEINPKEPRYLKVVWGLGYKVEKI